MKVECLIWRVFSSLEIALSFWSLCHAWMLWKGEEERGSMEKKVFSTGLRQATQWGTMGGLGSFKSMTFHSGVVIATRGLPHWCPVNLQVCYNWSEEPREMISYCGKGGDCARQHTGISFSKNRRKCLRKRNWSLNLSLSWHRAAEMAPVNGTPPSHSTHHKHSGGLTGVGYIGGRGGLPFPYKPGHLGR